MPHLAGFSQNWSYYYIWWWFHLIRVEDIAFYFFSDMYYWPQKWSFKNSRKVIW